MDIDIESYMPDRDEASMSRRSWVFANGRRRVLDWVLLLEPGHGPGCDQYNFQTTYQGNLHPFKVF